MGDFYSTISRDKHTYLQAEDSKTKRMDASGRRNQIQTCSFAPNGVRGGLGVRKGGIEENELEMKVRHDLFNFSADFFH